VFHIDNSTRGRVGSMETVRLRADKREHARSPIHDVQSALFDVQRGFSDCFA
jgi:hypothetical protein